MGDSMVKKLNGCLRTKKIKHKGIVKVRPFTTTNISCMQDHVKPTYSGHKSATNNTSRRY